MNEFINILNKPENQGDFLWSSRFIDFCKAYSDSEQAHLDDEEIKQSILNSDLVDAIESLVSFIIAENSFIFHRLNLSNT